MKLTAAVVLYMFVWWLTLFAVIPFNVRTQEEEGHVVPGTPESAPAKARILRIFVINTIVAAIVFAGVQLAIMNHWSFDITQLFEKARSSSPIP